MQSQKSRATNRKYLFVHKTPARMLCKLTASQGDGKVNALNGQIADQRALIAEPSTGIAKKLAEFERLSLMREFAKMSLASANTALDNARTEARRQQLYLERVVEPNLPDFPISPQRLRMIATIIGGNALFLLVIWLFYMGVREHGAGAG